MLKGTNYVSKIKLELASFQNIILEHRVSNEFLKTVNVNLMAFLIILTTFEEKRHTISCEIVCISLQLMTKLLIDYEIIDRDWQRPQSNCENDYCQHELDQKHT